jgi:putative transposase
MSHSYVQVFVHVIFSTKERKPVLTPRIRDRLFPYIGGIARQKGFLALEVGGVEDHVHALISVPSSMPLMTSVDALKGVSSNWMHGQFPELQGVRWQEGYGGFSVGASEVDRIVAYIRNQEQHHQSETFEQEFIRLCRSYGVDARLFQPER